MILIGFGLQHGTALDPAPWTDYVGNRFDLFVSKSSVTWNTAVQVYLDIRTLYSSSCTQRSYVGRLIACPLCHRGLLSPKSLEQLKNIDFTHKATANEFVIPMAPYVKIASTWMPEQYAVFCRMRLKPSHCGQKLQLLESDQTDLNFLIGNRHALHLAFTTLLAANASGLADRLFIDKLLLTYEFIVVLLFSSTKGRNTDIVLTPRSTCGSEIVIIIILIFKVTGSTFRTILHLQVFTVNAIPV
ncbi:hypothetical protein BC943DRAFT_355155 [Umbelopsis sp. AD052]|nr:hypothetical protein BC943DRAFT_355155 [Umbelopsis sp. AD052]